MTHPLTVRARRAVLPDGTVDDATLFVDEGRFVDGAADGAETLALDGLTLLPGFLDLHLHGAGGADTMDATPEALRTICRIHAQHGTTGWLATTMTQSGAAIDAALANAARAAALGTSFCIDGAQVLGIHLEGPYISPEKPGAQPKQFVRDFDAEEFARWLFLSDGWMKRITLAPERPGAADLDRRCRAAGIAVSLGHTDASAAQLREFLDHGPCDATHLFNAMNGIHHRKPGPIPVFLTDPRCHVEMICDGHHVAPEVVALAVRAGGVDRAIAITDAMAGAGAGDGHYDLGGNPVTVADGKALLADGTLAGSVLCMDRAAANLRDWCGLGWDEIAKVTSANAARRMGWTTKGRLAPGADADFVAVDDDLTVHATFVAGRCVYQR